MDSKLVKQLSLVGFLLLLARVATAAFFIPLNSTPAWQHRPEADLRLPMDMPEFCLRDQNGELACRQNLLGHVWLVDFVYLQCGDTCQLLTAQMITLQLKPSLKDVRFLSFSVDPKEGPAGLKRFINRLPLADASRWSVLAADDLQFPPLAVAMGLANSTREIHEGYVPYSRCFFLIDPDGRVCGRYVGTTPDDMKRLERDLSTLIQRNNRTESHTSAIVTSKSTQGTP